MKRKKIDLSKFKNRFSSKVPLKKGDKGYLDPSSKKPKRSVKSSNGSLQDLIKKRLEATNENLDQIEKLLSDYEGGGILVIKQTYDEQGKPEGAHIFHAGVNDAMGLLALSEAVNQAAEEVRKEARGAAKNQLPDELSDIIGKIEDLLK